MVGWLRYGAGRTTGAGRRTSLYLVTLAVLTFCFMDGHAQNTPVLTTAVSARDAPPAAPGDENLPPLTKDQAKDLFSRVDKILSFVSTDSGLPMVHGVKRKLITRDQVNKYLVQKFDEDAGAKHLAREEIVLKKFGLLDRDFHMRPFMISLLTEQVAGFYDDKTKTVNLLDWIDPDEQEPVLAHELTHALQDQAVGLTKWSVVGSDEIARNAQEDNQHIQTDEGDDARDAVTEGQAMLVYFDYSLRSSGQTLKTAPELMDKLKNTLSNTSGSPILARAPLLLQKSLLFPYSEGTSFEDAVLMKGGKDAAFAAVLANPPSSTFEILHPAAYMSHVPVPMLRLPDIHPLIDADYAPYDVGVMGEFDVQILTQLFGGDEASAALTPQWNGGIYYAAQKRSAVTDAEKNSTASLALLYRSSWRSQNAARAFLHVYADQLPRKYSGLVRRSEDEADADEQVYTTDEGDVLLSISGEDVFIGEGFPLQLARKLRDNIAGVQSKGPLQLARIDTQQSPAAYDPGLSLVHMFSSAGVMKEAIQPDHLSSQRYTSIKR